MQHLADAALQAAVEHSSSASSHQTKRLVHSRSPEATNGERDQPPPHGVKAKRPRSSMSRDVDPSNLLAAPPEPKTKHRQACIACRHLKIKCLEAEDGDRDACLRCQRLNIDCLWKEASRRGRKRKSMCVILFRTRGRSRPKLEKRHGRRESLIDAEVEMSGRRKLPQTLRSLAVLRGRLRSTLFPSLHHSHHVPLPHRRRLRRRAASRRRSRQCRSSFDPNRLRQRRRRRCTIRSIPRCRSPLRHSRLDPS